MSADSALLELRLVGDIAGSFRVARYQRGYRWGTLEVERLLNDIWESKGEPYSLQPVVVKRDSESTWELIDGQQRLTTLFLIFAFMQREGLQNAGTPYSIKYDTRSGSEDYLQKLDADRANSNIDYFHLHRAYGCIRAWFDAQGPRRQYVANKFYGYLFESVRVIWYEAPKDQDSTTLFTRLNVGKIPLTDAELLKALLLSSSRSEVGRTDRSHEIAAQWDSIERDLQHPDIWAFVADEASAENPTRINLLLDTIAGGPSGRARPRFHTFDVLRQVMEHGGPGDVWNRVVELHATVVGWYENRDNYHKIGYLVAVGERFSDIVALADSKTKSDFGAILDSRISNTLDLTPSEVASLGYESDIHKDKCARVLLLMNVETVRRQIDSSERYPFRIHRSGAWSLEHIHAQNAELLTKAEQWKEWLRLHREALLDLPSIEKDSRDNLLRRIEDAGDQIDRQRWLRKFGQFIEWKSWGVSRS
ncbi:uncharacterized protein DUF262 [Paraburkholderia sp. BL6669N2]|uniref:DUF262 domain-containing protein n=1 Tax=Paraburkholderia sp. BL6669N2 TaxID=1938807 RepID=UPI000E375B23|nr:DUF262 domain-containing protein [Paraburkholderia sp. BL6669N2]REG48989.1 uncharacterized protein DUF262 [Paraburkholderia sp. BL6669N2]